MPTVFHQYRVFGFVFILMLLCSCAATRDRSAVVPASTLPAEMPMNKDAGDGQKLCLPLRMENGKELLLVVDTGSGATILDKSLAPMFTNYLGSAGVNNTWLGETSGDVYEAPKLYLGNTQLLVGNVIYLADLSQVVERPIAGILGMDCLRHYCIQLDFAAGNIRFLDPKQMKGEKLGRKYGLTYFEKRPVIDANLFGQSETYCVDTGDDDDAAFKPNLFQQNVQDLVEKSALGTWITLTSTNYAGRKEHEGIFPESCVRWPVIHQFCIAGLPRPKSCRTSISGPAFGHI